MKLVRNTIAVAALAFASSAAFAGTSPQTDDFVVSITHENDCAINFSDVDHGPTPSLASGDNATGAGTITCTFNDGYSIAMNVGTGGGTYASRTMTNGIDTLTFNLYRDAAHTEILGDGTSGTVLLSGNSTGGSTADSLTFYSRVDAGQTALTEGTYSSTITATATF
jgi:spore coat protein U-like protein